MSDFFGNLGLLFFSSPATVSRSLALTLVLVEGEFAAFGGVLHG